MNTTATIVIPTREQLAESLNKYEDMLSEKELLKMASDLEHSRNTLIAYMSGDPVKVHSISSAMGMLDYLKLVKGSLA